MLRIGLSKTCVDILCPILFLLQDGVIKEQIRLQDGKAIMVKRQSQLQDIIPAQSNLLNHQYQVLPVFVIALGYVLT